MIIPYNKRVVSRVGQCFWFEPSGSNVWSGFCWRDHSDHTAHAKHYAYFWKQKLFIYLALHKMSPT